MLTRHVQNNVKKSMSYTIWCCTTVCANNVIFAFVVLRVGFGGGAREMDKNQQKSSKGSTCKKVWEPLVYSINKQLLMTSVQKTIDLVSLEYLDIFTVLGNCFYQIVFQYYDKLWWLWPSNRRKQAKAWKTFWGW